MINQKTQLKKLNNLTPSALIALLALGLLQLFSNPTQASPLKDHPSIYLANHANDPINWQIWNQETLETAKQNNQLILVSSGYFSCHWCHVMQQENYQDLEVAQLVNQNYLPIKLDREIQTQLDDYFIEFARSVTGRAGWPLHIILTPDAKPLISFVYQPKKQLLTTLTRANQWWQDNPQHLQQLADSNPNLQTANQQTTTLEIAQLKQQIYQELPQLIDDLSGGFNATQKFPNSPLLLALLQQNDLPEQLHEWLELTLEQMQNHHLQDHIHGGFFRYTIDPEWQTPHYEKMLYDNAQLLEIYYLAHTKFNNPSFLTTAQNTLTYIQQELLSPTTQLAYSSQSSLDNNHQEGGRYLWTQEQLKNHLTPEEFQLITHHWNLENSPILPTKISHPLWKNIQQKLNNRPAITDDKQLLGWNGLLLAALAQAYKTHPYPQLKHQGDQLAKALTQATLAPLPPKAINDQNQQIHTASLADLTTIYRGLNCWHQLTQKAPYPADSVNLTQLKQHINNQLKQLNPNQPLAADSATPTYQIPQATSIPTNHPAWRYASYLHRCH